MINSIKKLIPKPLFGVYHFTLAGLGNLIYASPSKKLFLIGVTGTKGKTTTSYFIYQLLENLKQPTALTSTTFFAIEDKMESNNTKMGMPGRFFLPHFLNRAIKSGIKFAVVETTSEGIAQHRQYFLDYDVVVFTSLSPEHIERHGSFAAYKAAKERLFEQCQKTHIINLNDKHAKDFLKYPAEEKWGVVLDKKIPQNSQVSFILEGTLKTPEKLKITEWKTEAGNKELIDEAEIEVGFPGKFNAMNLLLGLASARAAQIPFQDLTNNVFKLKLPPGRMQEVVVNKVPFRIFIDYAHEPLSLQSALESCREFLEKDKKLICLIGAQGGGRDKWKRKVMGQTASKLCDYVIVGTEDPYEENLEEINREVLAGTLSNKDFEENKNCWQFTDRREAIQKALSLAKAGDIVILCGKGGEKFMCLENKKVPWDEEKEVKNILAKLNF